MNSIKKNYIFNLSYQILAIIVPLLTTPYVSRVLGAKAIGDYNYINGIVSYFGLVAVTGTATFGNREIAIVHTNIKKRSNLFWEIILFRIICTCIAFIPYMFLIMNTSELYHKLFIINILFFFSWIFDVSWFCQGMENFKVTAIRNSLVKLLGVVLIFLLVKTKDDLWKYTMIYSGTMLLGNLTMWVYVAKNIVWTGWKSIHIFKNTKTIFQLFIPVIAVQIYTVMDQTMLGFLDNTKEVAFYSQAHRIIELAITVVNAFIAVLLPRIAFLFSNKEYEKLKDLLNQTIQYIFLLSLPMIIGCILAIDQFVPVFFGKGYEPVGNIIKILSCMFIILNLGRLFGTLLVAIGKQNRYTFATIIVAVLNLFLNMVFIMGLHMGAIGVSIASIISELVATSVQFWDIRNYIKLEMILSSARKYSIPSLIMGIAIIVWKQIIHGNDTFMLISEVVIGVFVYFGCLLIGKDDWMIGIIRKVKRIQK